MIFLNLGIQPLANDYPKITEVKKKEKKYKLLIDFDKKNKLVSIKKRFSSKSMFNEKYPYRSSMSNTMKESFKKFANDIKKKIKPKKILEIGCNDGSFLKFFDKNSSLGVEPCKNIAKLSKAQNINVIEKYWNLKLSKKILQKFGKFDLIYSANTITHINDLNDVFKSINIVLEKNGILIIEDPSLLECINNNAYDQFYNEHVYVFSCLGLSKLLKKNKFKIFKVENLKVHGGSLRYYISNEKTKIKIHKSVFIQKQKEINKGLDNFITYKKFAKKVKSSKLKLKKIFENLKERKKVVIGYGATAKSVTVLNYCKINNSYIKYFLDTTPEKKNKLLPGLKIPIKKYNKKLLNKANYVFLGAWNFEKEIIKKEHKYIRNGGKFFTHIPKPRFIK